MIYLINSQVYNKKKNSILYVQIRGVYYEQNEFLFI